MGQWLPTDLSTLSGSCYCLFKTLSRVSQKKKGLINSIEIALPGCISSVAIQCKLHSRLETTMRLRPSLKLLLELGNNSKQQNEKQGKSKQLILC